jgi:hypothetical protein
MVGTKVKNGKTVPNCVPKETAEVSLEKKKKSSLKKFNDKFRADWGTDKSTHIARRGTPGQMGEALKELENKENTMTEQTPPFTGGQKTTGKKLTFQQNRAKVKSLALKGMNSTKNTKGPKFDPKTMESAHSKTKIINGQIKRVKD